MRVKLSVLLLSYLYCIANCKQRNVCVGNSCDSVESLNRQVAELKKELASFKRPKTYHKVTSYNKYSNLLQNNDWYDEYEDCDGSTTTNPTTTGSSSTGYTTGSTSTEMSTGSTTGSSSTGYTTGSTSSTGSTTTEFSTIGVSSTVTTKKPCRPRSTTTISSTTTSDSLPSCNICASNPCLNNGICYADPYSPWSLFTCDCPYNYAGNICQEKLVCTANSCGRNADCSISNHQINCVCYKGYGGNPRAGYGCDLKTKTAQIVGDPHVYMYDGYSYPYQGTCPFIFSQPCTTLNPSGYSDFSVTVKNELTSTTSRVSDVKELEVVFFGHNIHIDSIYQTVYFDGILVYPPYYWPSSTNRSISITKSGTTITATNNEQISVWIRQNAMAINVPAIDAFSGPNVLCGPAGSLGGAINTNMYLKYRNGTYASLSDPVQYTAAVDSWITNDWLYINNKQQQCMSGTILRNTTNCNPTVAQTTCLPIQNALSGTGPFAKCINMTSTEVTNYYQNCIYDLCNDPSQKCNVMNDFVDDCQTELPDTDLGPWRTNPVINCPLHCPIHSTYSSCMSACPATCAEHETDHCERGCEDGCECDPGFILDNTQPDTVCIRVEECGCNDPDGNSHPADEPWYTNDCEIRNECINGTYTSKPNQCGQYGSCTIDDGKLGCNCNIGFTGDGYNCTDINECLDPNTCGERDGNGECYNTIGSYNCYCNLFFEGNDCEYYLPTRHCADLYYYHNLTEDGVYWIDPPIPNNSSTTGEPKLVYCDMTRSDENGIVGGYTLMASSIGNDTSYKTMSNYKNGFGDASKKNIWLGLDTIYGITNQQETSLFIEFYRCPLFNHPTLTNCTYPSFTVRNESLNYRVNIPQLCNGSEYTTWSSDGSDGWVKWDYANDGPGFSAYNNIQNSCSMSQGATGWWFDNCGSANFNGDRYTCDNKPSDTRSYINWGGYSLLQAYLYLRPKNYPNYDPHPVTPLPQWLSSTTVATITTGTNLPYTGSTTTGIPNTGSTTTGAPYTGSTTTGIPYTGSTTTGTTSTIAE